MIKPTPFSVDAYVRWHEQCVPADVSLVSLLEESRKVMMGETRPDLEFLYKILSKMFTYARNEFPIEHHHAVSYQTPLLDALATDPSGDVSSRYEELFKSVPSIVNKMWRKADDEPRVTGSNYFEAITDLIRTDVWTETLDSARFLARRMNKLPEILDDEKLKSEYTDRIVSISFEPEMKMASGYFAYHGLVRFKIGYTAEVQIYSALMSEWRKLSHQLYEKVRLEPITQHEFASPEARLISLGHALHLAECEIMRLRQEIEKK